MVGSGVVTRLTSSVAGARARRLTLFAAAWTVTAPYNDDAAPSGTSSRRSGRPVSAAQAAAMREHSVPAATVVSKDPLTG